MESDQNIPENERLSQYERIKSILDQYAGKDLFKDIDPVEWQREIRKEWERDFSDLRTKNK